MLPPPVLELLATRFAGTTIADIAPTVGGFSNLTVTAMIAGHRYAAKIAGAAQKRAGVRREHAMLALLQHTPLPTPAPVALLEDDDWVVEVMHALPGVNGLLVHDTNPAALPAIFTALGTLLAQVHSVVLPCPSSGFVLAERFAQVQAALAELDLVSHLHDTLAASLDNPAWHDGRQLVHGDAGMHNVLWDGQIAALLDWEWAGWGNPLVDLAWVYWTTRFRNLPEQWQQFLHAYAVAGGVAASSAEEVRALVLGQIAAMLVRVQSTPAAWDEWMRRLDWTLTLDFPPIVATPQVLHS